MNQKLIEELENERGGALAGADARYDIPASAFTENECASDLIDEAFAAHNNVGIPYLPFPVLLNRPIILASGQALEADPNTVFQMMPNCGGCMVRSAHPKSGRKGPADLSCPDTDMRIEGGVWDNGQCGIGPNDRDPESVADFKGALTGIFFFCNAQYFTIRNVTLRNGSMYGILITGCRHFRVEDIVFDRYRKDGVHVNGPTTDGLIQRMRGQTGDDFVALNAWDWCGSAVGFGEIGRILVQDLACTGDELRLLPGRKTYKDGQKTECPIYDCVFRRITNAYCIKMYQQPNCSNDLTGENDKSEIAGTITNVDFYDIGLDALTAEGFGDIEVAALFEIIADCSNITFDKIRVGVTEEEFRSAGLRLTEVGTKSSTWKHGSDDPKTWCELFDTELVCTADHLTFRDITFAGKPCVNRDTIIGCHKLTPNPDYPNTLPRGGNGYGIIGSDVTIE